MKILIIRFSSIGDIVLTTPVVRNLKIQRDAIVHYVTKQAYRSILSSNPYIDKIHVLNGSLGSLITELRKENFDVIIDLHNNLRSRIIKARLRKKSFTFHKLNLKKWIFVNFKINLLPNVHIVDRYMQTVQPLGVKMDNLGLDYFIPEKDEIEDEWLPETHKSGFAVFVVGAKFKTKRLPVKRMIELCDRINKPIVLVGGKEDQEVAEEITAFFEPGSQEVEKEMEVLNKKTVIFNACGKFSLNQSASIISKANWVFTHDTGMMHVAAAFKKYVFSIWGNTTPLFGMFPYRTQFIIFENNKIGCRPCSKIGFEKCPKGHFKCMNDLTFDFYLPD
ncbi:MAG: glycosyltransferase family 9 protein [Bacteroidota bacterium]